MKLLAIVKNGAIGNTMQIAEAMAEIAPLTIADFDQADRYNLSQYDAVGFAGGIYCGKHDKKLIEFVKKLEVVPKYSFTFSTSATKAYDKHNSTLNKLLERKGSTVLGTFGCKGLCKFFIFGLFGGINKGHPDMDDFDAAQAFIGEIMRKLESERSSLDAKV